MEGLSSKDVKAFSRQRLAPVRRYSIGVDPGTQTGIGIFDRQTGQIIHFMTTDFFGAADRIRRLVRVSEATVHVEIPGTFMYDRNNGGQNQKTRDRMMVNCGGVRREAQLLAELLRREGFNIVEVRPVQQKKWDEQQFQQATKIYQKTNQHERDAVRLAIAHANDRDLVAA